MSEDSDSISEEERSLFRPFTRESLAAIEARIAEELAKQKELEKKRAEGEVWARIRPAIAYCYDFSSRAAWLRQAHTIYHTRTSQDVPRAASNKYIVAVAFGYLHSDLFARCGNPTMFPERKFPENLKRSRLAIKRFLGNATLLPWLLEILEEESSRFFVVCFAS